MFKKIKERQLHLIIIAFLIGLLLGSNFSLDLNNLPSEKPFFEYLKKTYNLIKLRFVEEIDSEKILTESLKGMLKSLKDPFSRVLNQESLETLKEIKTGQYKGLGIEVTFKDGQLIIISPLDDSPAKKAGLLSGDIIKKINNLDLNNLETNEIINLIKNPEKNKVKLNIKRKNLKKLLTFEIKKEFINFKSTSWKIIFNHQIAYLRIKTFSITTASEIEKILKEINEKKLKKLIIDLRNNAGGLLDAAIKTADLFLLKGETIVSTKDKNKFLNIYKSTQAPLFQGKIIVLVNQGSASASEILAAALKDNNKAKLLGEKTFGKASVQETFKLNKKLALALTVAKYYTPAGKLIHHQGLEPDYKVNSSLKSDQQLKMAIKKINQF